MRNWMIAAGLTLCMGMGGAVLAGDGESCGDKAKSAAKTGCCAKDKNASLASCSDKKAGACKDVAGMPTMSYKVGDKCLCCPKEALETAKADGKSIKFVVAGKEFDGEADAMKAYAAALETFLAKSTTVSYAVGDEAMQCPMSAESVAQKSGKKVQYRLASYNFEDAAKAEKAAKAAREAADKVSMKVLVDGKEVEAPKSGCCGSKATTVAKSTSTDGKAGACDGKTDVACAGKSTEYVIGDQKFTCSLQANVELQKARIAAAMMVMEKAVAGA